MNIKKRNWQEYRDKLLPLVRATEKRNTHIFSDEIDKALSDEMAFLFVGEDGFFILQPQVRDGVTVVNIMFAYSDGQNAIHRYQSRVELMARQIGARKLVLQTKVTGLAKLLESEGWALDGEAAGIFHWFKVL